jgi:ABC-type transport system involved in multi-copper enzyme maturation permease subunit
MTSTAIDSTVTGPVPPSRFGARADTAIPLSRLVRVELRKMADTRSGKWLLIGLAAITVVIVAIYYVTAEPAERTFLHFMGATLGPQGFLLPVLGILLITSEWSQRTGLVSFTLVPLRGRVLTAKVLAGLFAGVAAIVLSVGFASLATVISGTPDGFAHFGPDELGKFGILQITGILQGLAFGLLFLSSAPAITSYFVFPTALNIVGSLWKPLRDVQPWIDLWASQAPLFTAENLDGEQWAQIGTSNLIWVVAPFLFGLLRVLRTEVK